MTLWRGTIHTSIRSRSIHGWLSIVVFDAQAFGGQAGASARIENYLGFPTGISGRDLAGRAYVQAQKFGAEMAIPTEISRLDCGQNPLVLEFGDGGRTKASAVVIASGARYRRLDVPNLSEFEGRGVWYWASPIEARLCRNEEIVLVGGGNSAGQAAVFLRDYAAKIWLLVRGPSLPESMSQYLIDRIYATSNIEVLTKRRSSRSRAHRNDSLSTSGGAIGFQGRKLKSRSGICFFSSVLSRRLGGCTAAFLSTQKASCKRVRARHRRSALDTTEQKRCRCNPTYPAFSQSETCAPVRSNASALRSAKEPE